MLLYTLKVYLIKISVKECETFVKWDAIVKVNNTVRKMQAPEIVILSGVSFISSHHRVVSYFHPLKYMYVGHYNIIRGCNVSSK